MGHIGPIRGKCSFVFSLEERKNKNKRKIKKTKGVGAPWASGPCVATWPHGLCAMAMAWPATHGGQCTMCASMAW